MSETSTNKQDNTDVLRAEDIVPPYSKEIHQGQDLQKTETNQRKDMSSQNEQKQSLKDITSQFVGEKGKHVEGLPAESADPVQQTSQIPKFDLAEQIMAEQRKITAIRRKAPGKKTKAPDRQPQAQSTGYTIKPPPPTLSEQEQIIAEIVARDIEIFCRCDTSSIHNR